MAGTPHSDLTSFEVNPRYLRIKSVMDHFFREQSPSIANQPLDWKLQYPLPNLPLPGFALEGRTLNLLYDFDENLRPDQLTQQIDRIEATLNWLVDHRRIQATQRMPIDERNSELDSTIRKFFEDYHLSDRGCTWTLIDANSNDVAPSAFMPQVHWSGANKKMDVRCQLRSGVSRDIQQESVKKLRESLMQVRGKVILDTFSVGKRAELLEAISETRLSGNAWMRQAWKELDQRYPSYQEIQKAEVLFCETHEPVDQSAQAYSHLDEVWSETVTKKTRPLTINDVRRIVEDCAARMQAGGSPLNSSERFLTIDQFSEQARADILQNQAADIKFPEVFKGYYTGPVVRHTDYLKQAIAGGTIAHRIEDLENLPQNEDVDYQFDISYINGKAACHPAQIEYTKSLVLLRTNLVRVCPEMKVSKMNTGFSYTGEVIAVSPLHFILKTQENPPAGVIFRKGELQKTPLEVGKQYNVQCSNDGYVSIERIPLQQKSDSSVPSQRRSRSLDDRGPASIGSNSLQRGAAPYAATANRSHSFGR